MRFKARQGPFGRPAFAALIDKMPSYCLWQQFGSHLPHLQWFAVRILSMVASASAPERFFSKLKWVKSLRRNRLSAEKVKRLLWVHYNMALLERARSLDYAEYPGMDTLAMSLLEDQLLALEIDEDELVEATVVEEEEEEGEEL